MNVKQCARPAHSVAEEETAVYRVSVITVCVVIHIDERARARRLIFLEQTMTAAAAAAAAAQLFAPMACRPPQQQQLLYYRADQRWAANYLVFGATISCS